jgi:hypothetical protein
MFLGGVWHWFFGSGQAIEKEETSSFMVDFGGGNKEGLVLRSNRC